jgi:hypothetical protein
MDQTPQDIPPAHIRKDPRDRSLWSGRGTKFDAPVGPLLVVMAGELTKDAVEMSSAEHEGEVEKFAAHGANKALSERVRPGSPDRSPNHPDALGEEHLIESARVLGIAVADQEPNVLQFIGHREVAGLLGAEGPSGLRVEVVTRSRRVPTSMKNST